MLSPVGVDLSLTTRKKSAFANIVLKLICFCVASALFTFECRYVYRVCKDRSTLNLFFMSWTIFPVLFLLGPEGFGIIDLGMSSMLHAIGDLISKNFVGIYINHLKENIERKASIFKLEKQLTEEIELARANSKEAYDDSELETKQSHVRVDFEEKAATDKVYGNKTPTNSFYPISPPGLMHFMDHMKRMSTPVDGSKGSTPQVCESP